MTAWHLEPIGITAGFMTAVLADEDVREALRSTKPRTPPPGLSPTGGVDGGTKAEPPPEWMRAIARYLDEAGVDYTLD